MRLAIEEKIKSINEEYGILSLASSADNLLMWAHYADEHKGAVIGIDIEDQAFAGEARPVRYSSLRPELDLSEEVLLKHFFVKSPEWRYENEFRVVRPLNESVEKRDHKPFAVYLFELPSSCIKSVVFGLRFPSKRVAKICKKIHKEPRLAHICFFKARMNDNEFKLSKESLSPPYDA